MEKNKDTKTNMMDLLPDIIVIKIFEYLENLADLLTLPKVNYRFKELSKLKCSRNHLLIKDNDFDVDFLEKMKPEIDKCRDLKSITAVANFARFDYYNYNFSSLKFFLINSLNGNTEYEIIKADIDTLFMSNGVRFLYSVFKKSAGDMSRLVQMAPSAVTSIESIDATGSPKIFPTAIEKSTDTLEAVKYTGTNVTFAHLKALGECNNMKFIQLTAKLVVPDEVPATVTNIPAKGIILRGNFLCPYVADIFFSENLVGFTVDYCTINGLENELHTKCPKLRYLVMSMEAEREDVPNHHLVDSIIKLVDTLKEHESLQEISITNINQHIRNSLYEPLSACLESIAGSEIDISRFSGGHPYFYNFYIILKR